jgi:hypothetical protein
MAKVFIINDLNHNFDKAARFGELHFVTKGKVPIFKTDTAKAMLDEGLSGFNIVEDYLLVSGPAILCMMSTLIVATKMSPSVQAIKTLVFDAKEQDYVVRHISI